MYSGLLSASKLYKRCCHRVKELCVSQSRHSSAGTFLHSKVSVGDEVYGFKVTDLKDIPELQLTAVRLTHSNTGADYLHIAKDDPNNVFSIGFRTTPMDSTGVPHILEHTVLCGSKRYPVRDPFFKMLNRSLSTFMNAMTGNDFTMYPFSTQNLADYNNLMSVYLDAVFKPNLNKLDFYQEGWRLEHSKLDDKNSPLIFKGVVFNEMKGVFADSQNLFVQKLQNGILPSHTYGVVSGGYPLDIPNLTYSSLKKFHSHHYHPSNSRIYSYGNFNLFGHLQYIHENYLEHYTKIEPNTEVPEEPRWSKPYAEHIHCGVDPLAPANLQNNVAEAYLLADITDTYECFVLQILSELLVSGPNAPFYKSLLESKLGSSYSPGTGFNGDTRTTTFTIGLQGVAEESVDNILATIETTFSEAKKTGFPQERIEAILHGIELGMKHQSANFGLGVIMSLASPWNHDCDPVRALEINSFVDKLKNSLKENPMLFQDKINQYFLKNKHKYTLTMSPKEDYEQKLKQKEEKLLEKCISGLNEKALKKVYETGLTLASNQNSKECLDCLPTLKVSDISRKVQPTVVKNEVLSGVNIQVNPQPTNEVAYFYAILDAQKVPQDLLPYIPLLCSIMTKMGAGTLNFKDFDQQVEMHTGGLGVGTILEPHVDNFCVEKAISLSSHCLQKNVPKMFNLWENVINALNMSNIDRLSTLVKMIATNISNGVIHSGHRYAMVGASAAINNYGATKELWGGLTHVALMNDLAEQADLTDTLQKLKELANILLGKECMRVAINVTDNNVDPTLKELEAFLNNIKGSAESYITHPDDTTQNHNSTDASRVHHVFPFPVNFTSRAVAGVPYNHPDAGALRVLGRIMFPILHREIREKGGAYGGGASVSPGGPLAFYSYRDPNASKTFSAFNEAIEWAHNGQFTDRDIEEAKLGVFQSIDAPVAPGSRGLRLFRSHITDSMFEAHRVRVLDASREDIVRVAREHVKAAAKQGECLIGPACDDMSAAKGWTVIQH